MPETNSGSTKLVLKKLQQVLPLLNLGSFWLAGVSPKGFFPQAVYGWGSLWGNKRSWPHWLAAPLNSVLSSSCPAVGLWPLWPTPCPRQPLCVTSLSSCYSLAALANPVSSSCSQSSLRCPCPVQAFVRCVGRAALSGSSLAGPCSGLSVLLVHLVGPFTTTFSGPCCLLGHAACSFCTALSRYVYVWLWMPWWCSISKMISSSDFLMTYIPSFFTRDPDIRNCCVQSCLIYAPFPNS